MPTAPQSGPPGPTPDVGVGRAVVSKLARRLIPFLFLLYVVAYLDRTNVGFAALQMQAQLGLSDAVYGLGAGIFFAGYFLFQVPSNLLLERVGARRWIASIMVVWGLTASAMMGVRTTHGFYALRFLLGAAEAGFFPGVILYLKRWFPATARARAVAWFMAAGPISGAVGSPISGALLGMDRLGGMAGWQWLFLLEGIPAMVLGAVVVLFLEDRVSGATWLSADERAWLEDTMARERLAQPSQSGGAWAGFTTPHAWLLAFVYFGLNACAYGLFLWLPTFIHRLSGDRPFTIGVLSAIPNLAAAVAMVLVGAHSDRSGERRWHIALPAFVAVAALITIAYKASSGMLVLGASLALAGVFAMDGPFWATPSALLSDTAAAAGIAMINALGNLGSFFGPYIIGSAKDAGGGFKRGLLIIAAVLAASGAVALLVKPRRR